MCAWAAGTFTRTNGVHTGSTVWQDDKAAGTPILASRADTHDYDLAQGINQCVNKDGSNATNVVKTAWIEDGAITEAKLHDDAASRSTTLISAYVLAGDGSAAATTILRNLSVSVSRLSMPKAGKITHLSINIQQPLTSGTLTMGIYKNGVDSGQTVVMTGGTGVVDRTAALASAVSFAAGDYLQIYYSTSSAVFTTGTSQGIYQAWGHFTE